MVCGRQLSPVTIGFSSEKRISSEPGGKAWPGSLLPYPGRQLEKQVEPRGLIKENKKSLIY